MIQLYNPFHGQSSIAARIMRAAISAPLRYAAYYSPTFHFFGTLEGSQKCNCER
jgi:hypothetical protein